MWVPVYVVLLRKKGPDFWALAGEVETCFFVAPHKSDFVCSPEMEDIAEKRPILAYKIAESMFF